MISTAGFIREGLYDDIYNYAIQVLNGIADDDTLFKEFCTLSALKLFIFAVPVASIEDIPSIEKLIYPHLLLHYVTQ